MAVPLIAIAPDLQATVAVLFMPVETGREAVARAIDLTVRRAREHLGAEPAESAAIGPWEAEPADA